MQPPSNGIPLRLCLKPLHLIITRFLQDGLKRVQGKLDYSSIAFDLVPDTFTISDLRGAHEAILVAFVMQETFEDAFAYGGGRTG